MSWVDSYTDSWLREKILSSLGQDDRVELETVWQELQEKMCRYVDTAAGYQFLSNDNHPDYARISYVESAWASSAIIDEDADGVQQACYLIAEAPRLRGQVAQFKERLQNAISALD